MKARDYLVPLGLAKDGRGKFSRAAHEALAAAIAEGKTFSDYPKGVHVVKPAKVSPSKVTTDPKPTGDPSGIVALMPYRYDESSYVAREADTNVERSLREACRGCMVSLVVCWCEKPLIVARDGSGSVAVTIVARAA